MLFRQSAARRLLLSFAAMLIVVFTVPVDAQQALFTETVAFANKTGFRGVFAWKASRPVEALVRFGTAPDQLTSTAEAIPNTADTAGMAIVDGLTTGTTYYYVVEEKATGARSPVGSFVATNAYTDWNGSIYTIDLLIQLDLDSLSAGIAHDQALADIAQGVNVFAERVYDALDGFARVGKVIITDTVTQYAANVPFQPVPCENRTNLADVLVQTSVPFDSHTFGGFRINDPCTQFYVGRIGQLVLPWEDDLHFGYVMTHEMMHYGFDAPDLYGLAPNGGGAECRNLDWDGSLMHNSGGYNNGKWELTELDRNPLLTPCAHGPNPYTWDALRTEYKHVPLNPEGPIDHMYEDKARGNEDGGALEIWILDRQAGGTSTLTRYTPDDQVAACTHNAPAVADAEGDATVVYAVNTGYLNEPSLDITGGTIRWNAAAEALTFGIKLKDLTDLPPVASTGARYRFYFEYAGKRYQIMIDRLAGGPLEPLTQTVTLATLEGVALRPLTANANTTTDEITVVLTADDFAAAVPSAPRLATRSELGNFEILAQRAYATQRFFSADWARGVCPYFAGQESLGANTAPVAADDAVTIAEDAATLLDVLANDSDADGDSLTVRGVSLARNGRAYVEGTRVRYIPNGEFSGTDSFSYTAGDDRGGTHTARVTVTVTPVNDAPAAREDAGVAQPGGTATVAVLRNDFDAEGEPLTVTAVSKPRLGQATLNGNVVEYTAPAVFTGSDVFTYTVTDGQRSSTANVVITAVSCLQSFSDDFEPQQEPGWTFTNSNSGTTMQKWSLTPDPLARSLTNSFFGDSSDASPNKDDRMIAPPMKITSATRLSFWHRFGFEPTYDGGVLEVSTDGGRTFVDVLAAGGTFVRGGYNGTASAFGGNRPAWNGQGVTSAQMSEVVIDLGALARKTVLVSWRLRTDANTGSTGWWIDDVAFTGLGNDACAPANSAPNATDDAARTSRGAAVTIAALANDSDADGDALTITALTAPANGTATHDGRVVVYTPAAGSAGTETLHYTVADAFGATDTATITIVVNGAPSAANDSVMTNEDQPVAIDVTDNDSDPNGDALTVSSVTQPANGTAAANASGTISYTPKANFHGTDTFTYTVSDPDGETSTATVTVTVAPVNDAPLAANDAATTTKNTAVVVHVLANDSDLDGDTFRVTAVQPGMRRSAVTINPDGTIRYNPKPGFAGTDTFGYTITDANGATSTARVTVTITN